MMLDMKMIVDTLAMFALFISATLMIPQIIKIWRERSVEVFSLFSYIGFEIFQIAMVLHGIFTHDWVLILGMGFCLINNTITIGLIFKFRKPAIA